MLGCRIAYDMPIVLPLHPRTRNALKKNGSLKNATENLMAIDPVGYCDMLLLEKNARLIATDSGGVQKEAFFYGVPCLTLRDETEWTELVSIGCNRLVGADEDRLIAEFNALKSEEKIDWKHKQLYGDGRSAAKIVSHISNYFKLNERKCNEIPPDPPLLRGVNDGTSPFYKGGSRGI